MGESWPRVLPVGDRAVTVELGASLDEETVGRVRALDARLSERGLPEVTETVPAYASLLVIYDRDRISFAKLKETLLGLARGLKASAGAGRLVEIEALYDGEDLDEVAALCGLSRAEVVERHFSREYTVLMLGFSPGFAYMGFVDERLHLPRRKTPRTRVPEGSIAIAGAQTGVYPRTLPGGWNLLGRTSLRLFDASNPEPSRLNPGDRVRFVPTSSLTPPEPPPLSAYRGNAVRVLEPGVLALIQDAGRTGLRRLAVPRAGYADIASAHAANLCVGNSTDAPLIEICGPGLSLLFEQAAFIAITGARVTATLDREDLPGRGMAMPLNVAVRVRPSNVLTILGLDEGVRAYVAVSGLDAPRVLGSASVDLGSGFLRPLQTGDAFSVSASDADRVRRDPVAPPGRRDSVRVILGPQETAFDEATIERFFATPWLVGIDSDRVGARLDGARLTPRGATEIVSDGMVPGCIQVPPDGRPIVMLSDGPTTGGYPKIATVVSDDIGLVAQAMPGRTKLRFVPARIEDLQR